MKHTRVIKTSYEDGVTKESRDSYFEELSFTQTELEKKVLVTRSTILKEIINCLEYISRDGSPSVTMTIKAKDGQPVMMIKRWTTERIDFGVGKKIDKK